MLRSDCHNVSTCAKDRVPIFNEESVEFGQGLCGFFPFPPRKVGEDGVDGSSATDERFEGGAVGTVDAAKGDFDVAGIGREAGKVGNLARAIHGFIVDIAT